MDLAAERTDIRDALVAAGVGGVTLDPEGFVPPCVVVGLPTAQPIDDAHALVRTPVYVVVPGPAQGDAVRDMLATVGAVTLALLDPEAMPGLGALPAQNASGYTVTVATRAPRRLCP